MKLTSEQVSRYAFPHLAMSQPLLSRREIATKIKRSPTAVNNALQRLGATPAFVTGNFQYFKESIIADLEKTMRRKNHTARNTDGQ